MTLSVRHTGRIPRLAGLIACSFFMGAAASAADKYPAKPVRLIVPFAPGGGADLNARRLGNQLSDFWKQSVVIHNMGGAGGNLAAAATAASETDGYTMLFASIAIIVNNPTLYGGKLKYDPDKDLAPVVLVGSVPLVLMLNAATPPKDVKSLITLAKQRPNALNFGSGGVGTSMHLTGELFKARSGVDIVHVPFKGASAVVAAMMNGEVQVLFQNAGLAKSQVQTGRLKALAITSNSRMKILPDLPTFKESGMPGFTAAISYGIYVAGGTPSALVAQLNRDINKVLQNPKYREQMEMLGVEVGGGTPQELAAFVVEERKKWVPIITKLGLKK